MLVYGQHLYLHKFRFLCVNKKPVCIALDNDNCTTTCIHQPTHKQHMFSSCPLCTTHPTNVGLTHVSTCDPLAHNTIPTRHEQHQHTKRKQQYLGQTYKHTSSKHEMCSSSTQLTTHPSTHTCMQHTCIMCFCHAHFTQHVQQHMSNTNTHNAHSAIPWTHMPTHESQCVLIIHSTQRLPTHMQTVCLSSPLPKIHSTTHGPHQHT